MPLKRSSATSMKRTRCRFRLQLDLRPQLQLPLLRLPVPPVPNLISISPFEAVGKSGQLSDEYFVRLSLGLMPEEKKEDKKKLVKSDLRAIFGLFEGVWTTKPVWPINTSITTQLFQHSGRTDTDPGTLGGPVALLVRF